MSREYEGLSDDLGNAEGQNLSEVCSKVKVNLEACYIFVCSEVCCEN